MLIHAEPVRASDRSTCRTGSIYLLILALFSNPFTFSNLKSYPPLDILEISEDTSIDADTCRTLSALKGFSIWYSREQSIRWIAL